MHVNEKEVNHVGPGGYKCRCCGPAPKMRSKWRRQVRARLKVIHDKIIDRHEWSKHQETYHE